MSTEVTTPAAAAVTPPAASPAPVTATPPAAAPAAPAATPAGETPAKTYTDAELEAAKAQALAEYRQHLEEAKDYEKMTPEEKVTFLEAQRIDDKLIQATTTKLAAQELPVELLEFVKGKDEAETDARIKAIKGIIDTAAQKGVEKRFQNNGYLPKGSAVSEGNPDKKQRERGVKVQ